MQGDAGNDRMYEPGNVTEALNYHDNTYPLGQEITHRLTGAD